MNPGNGWCSQMGGTQRLQSEMLAATKQHPVGHPNLSLAMVSTWNMVSIFCEPGMSTSPILRYAVRMNELSRFTVDMLRQA